MLSTAQADPTPWLPLPEAADWLEGDAPAGTERANNYYRARYYDPKIGRFISEDPIGFEGGMNFYAYVFNNPVRFLDPYGLKPPTAGLREKIEAVALAGPIDANKAKRIADETYDDPSIGGLPGRFGGRQDAIRHCVWACRMVVEINPDDASDILRVHERANNRAGQTDADKSMDENNNREGLACGGRAGKSGRSCLEECLASPNLTTYR